MDSDNIRIAALSRPFTLGMLYDAREDALIPGFTLWDEKTLQEKTVETAQQSSTFNITASNSTESKSILLDVNDSLKASFLGGLIQVGGSAEYLNDNKKFRNQSRVTGQYKATTNFRELSLTDLTTNTQQLDLIRQRSATHVVTGILYGANAFFVFDSEKLESSSVQEIGGSMEDVMKKIPSLNIEGKVDIKLSDAEKALTDKFSCKFFGDFILDSNPATFVDAVKTYAELPKLLGEDGENSVPMVVWLMPLTHFDPKAAELKREISIGLLRKVEDALEDLTEIKMRCNDSLDEEVVHNFPHIREELKRFQELCGDYESNLQKTIAKALPSIRAGEEDESSVEKFLEDRDQSPFSHDKLRKWMKHEEREINVIRSFVDTMEGIEIVQTESELDRKVLAPGVGDALCFVFTYLEDGDPCLGGMAKYLDSSEVESHAEDLWYYSADVINKVREKAKVFQDLAKALKNEKQFRFLVASLPNDKYRGATIYQYKNGILVTKDFSNPPDVESITNRSYLIVYACELTLDPDTAHNDLDLSEGNKKVVWGSDKKDLPDDPERFTSHQALCKESLQERHYWEVEMTDGNRDAVLIAVAYKGVKRKEDARFGDTDKSWAFYRFLQSTVSARYNAATLWSAPLPSTGLKRVGVYLDWPAGTLSFYSVSSNTLSHLYTIRTTFTEPVYPGLMLGNHHHYAYLNLAE